VIMRLSCTIMEIWRLKYWTHGPGHRKKDGRMDRERRRGREKESGKEKGRERGRRKGMMMMMDELTSVALSPKTTSTRNNKPKQ